MNRTMALAFVLIPMLLLAGAACIAMPAMGVDEDLLTATVIAIAALASHLASRIVMHYPLPEKRER